MNPDIQKFWEDCGYKIMSISENIFDGKVLETLYWASHSHGGDVVQVALMSSEWETPVYLFYDKVYEEDHMLRIIRLKAFL
ncbi:MAG TPA: hypothetical protein VII94_01065 [Candidatus Saccharimonadales bacterium]